METAMKKLMMATAIGAVTLLSACSAEHGTTQCTTAPEAEWQNQDAFSSSAVSARLQN